MDQVISGIDATLLGSTSVGLEIRGLPIHAPGGAVAVEISGLPVGEIVEVGKRAPFIQIPQNLDALNFGPSLQTCYSWGFSTIVPALYTIYLLTRQVEHPTARTTLGADLLY